MLLLLVFSRWQKRQTVSSLAVSCLLPSQSVQVRGQTPPPQEPERKMKPSFDVYDVYVYFYFPTYTLLIIFIVRIIIQKSSSATNMMIKASGGL